MAAVGANNMLFDEVIDFLVSGPTPEQIIAFGPSETLRERMRYLLDGNSRGVLTAEEIAELNEFSRLNHFMSMLKIRARQNFDN